MVLHVLCQWLVSRGLNNLQLTGTLTLPIFHPYADVPTAYHPQRTAQWSLVGTNGIFTSGKCSLHWIITTHFYYPVGTQRLT